MKIPIELIVADIEPCTNRGKSNYINAWIGAALPWRWELIGLHGVCLNWAHANLLLRHRA